MNYALALLVPTLFTQSVFSDQSHAEALVQARETGRTLVLYFVSAGDGKARHMEETSWRSPLVVEWVRRDGLVLRLDVAEHSGLVEQYGIERTPALLWFEDGRERKRRHGDVPPSSLISWLHTPYGQLQSPEDLQRIFEDELAHLLTRLSARKLLAERLEPAQQLEHYLWMWHEGAAFAPDWMAIRLTSFASDMNKFARRYPPAAAAFGDLLAKAEASVLAGEADEDTCLDWLALAKHLDRDEDLLVLIRDVLVSQDAEAFPGLARSIAWRECRKRGDWAAEGMLVSDVESNARSIFEWHETLLGPLEPTSTDTPDSDFLQVLRAQHLPGARRTRATAMFSKLLVVGRTEDALLVAGVLLEQLDDVDSRLALIEGALEADAWRTGACAGEGAFSRHLAALPPMLPDLMGALRNWWGEARALVATYEQQARVVSIGERLTGQ